MSDAAEIGRLLLQLYELRTEPTLRQARAWFAFEFHPTTARDVLTMWLGPGDASASYRMVTTYWEMAAALVVHGAISPALFHDANTEHVSVWCLPYRVPRHGSRLSSGILPARPGTPRTGDRCRRTLRPHRMRNTPNGNGMLVVGHYPVTPPRSPSPAPPPAAAR